MTDYRHSAERIARMELAQARRALVWVGAKRLVFGVIVLAAFCAGQSHQRDRDAQARHKTLVDSAKHLETRIDTRAPVVQQTQHAATIAQAKHAAAARTFDAHVEILDDSTVRVDSGPPVHELPAALTIPEIRTARAALDTTAIALTVTAAQLTDMTADRDVWRRIATEKHSRFGLKTGLAIGASAVALAFHFLK
jgi:hypothetical protein